MKRAWAVLLVTLVVVLPARLYAVFNFVDLKTGFYTDGGKIRRHRGSCDCRSASYLSWCSAGRNVAEVSACTAEKRSMLRFLRRFPASLSRASLSSTLAGPDGLTVMNGLLALFGVCAAASFLTAAYDFAAGETDPSPAPDCSALAPLWGCLCLVSLFVSYVRQGEPF